MHQHANFIEIDQTVAEIQQFILFQDGGRPSFGFVGQILGRPTMSTW